jgi:hypothetical protein
MGTQLRRGTPVLAFGCGLALACGIAFVSAAPATAAGDTPAAGSIAGASPPARSAVRSVTPRSQPSVGGRLYDIAATSADDVWAVGLSGADPLVLHFNGAQWVEDLMPAGATFLNGVSAPSPSDVWAVGGSNWWSPSSTVAYHWDGSAWTRVQTPTPDGDAYFTAVAATSARNAWAVGLTGPGGPGVTGHYVPIIEHWNGSSWTRQFFRLPEHSGWLASIAAAGPRDAWAVGETGSEAPNSPLIEHWNGHGWRRFPTPPGLGDLQSVTVLSRNDAWAVGESQRNPASVKSLTLHWNGSRWYVVRSPNPTGNTNLQGVSGAGPDDVWAVGILNPNSCNPQCETAAFHWNGGRWTVVPSPDPPAQYLNDFLGVVAISRRDVWAVGSTDYAATLIAYWNGKNWN